MERKDIPPIKEIVRYYGQIYENVKHMKTYLNDLTERYINEHKD